MKKILSLLFVICFLACKQQSSSTKDFKTTFEKSNGAATAIYKETIEYYQQLADSYPEIILTEIGETDSGHPLQLVIYNTDGKTDINTIKNSPKNRVLINNEIHPGESDGIDASMMMLRDIVQSDSLKKSYKNTLINVIPIYNMKST